MLTRRSWWIFAISDFSVFCSLKANFRQVKGRLELEREEGGDSLGSMVSAMATSSESLRVVLVLVDAMGVAAS